MNKIPCKYLEYCNVVHQMIDWNLLRCAFGKHTLGKILHDDLLDQWIQICKFCNKTVVVDPPKDRDGKEMSPHVWLLSEERNTLEITDGEEK